VKLRERVYGLLGREDRVEPGASLSRDIAVRAFSGSAAAFVSTENAAGSAASSFFRSTPRAIDLVIPLRLAAVVSNLARASGTSITRTTAVRGLSQYHGAASGPPRERGRARRRLVRRSPPRRRA
jgi:hypothetical protein